MQTRSNFPHKREGASHTLVWYVLLHYCNTLHHTCVEWFITLQYTLTLQYYVFYNYTIVICSTTLLLLIVLHCCVVVLHCSVVIFYNRCLYSVVIYYSRFNRATGQLRDHVLAIDLIVSTYFSKLERSSKLRTLALTDRGWYKYFQTLSRAAARYTQDRVLFGFCSYIFYALVLYIVYNSVCFPDRERYT